MTGTTVIKETYNAGQDVYFIYCYRCRELTEALFMASAKRLARLHERLGCQW